MKNNPAVIRPNNTKNIELPTYKMIYLIIKMTYEKKKKKKKNLNF